MVSFRILALGGGGTKGFLHIGALQELESRVGNLTNHFSRGVYGCSIGSVVATGIAFGLNVKQMERISRKCLNLSFLMNDLNISGLTQVGVRKGVFTMDSFEKHLLKTFDLEGIDLRNKFLSDAKIPLFINASNLTRGIPTMFTGRVPVVSAIKASCCIPLIFQPQVIGTNVYVDGGVITNDLHRLIPKEDQADTLSIYLIHSNPHVTPETIQSLSTSEFLYKLYKTVCVYHHTQNDNPTTVLQLYYPGRSGLSDLSNDEMEDMMNIGRCLMRTFLTKNSL
jgi:predicted acylesterase/phospholipase RssA